MSLYEIRDERAAPGVILERLCRGDIVVLRAAPEIRSLVQVLNGLGSLEPARCDRFQFLHRRSALGIRQALRYASSAVSAGMVALAVAATAKRYGLPTSGLVEAGRLRAFFPPKYPRLWNRPASLYRQFLKKGVGAGNPLHRDIASPHRPTQINFWFPLSPIHQDQSLMMFPELWGQDISMDSQNRVVLTPPNAHPTQVAMDAGDVLLFHSENFHASPPNDHQSCRVSVDCRCVFHADDDNRYYSGGFQDITTFLPRDGEPRFDSALRAFLSGKRVAERKLWYQRLRQLVGLPMSRESAWGAANWASDDDAPASALMVAAEGALARGDEAEALDLCQRVVAGFPYADDRLFRIVLLTQPLEGGIAAKAADTMISRTDRPFWAVRLGDHLCSVGDYEAAADAYRRAQALAARASTLDEQMDAQGTAAVTRYPYWQTTNVHYVRAAERKLALLSEYGLMSSEST